MAAPLKCITIAFKTLSNVRNVLITNILHRYPCRLYSKPSALDDGGDVHFDKSPEVKQNEVKPGQAFKARKKAKQQAAASSSVEDQRLHDSKLVSAVDAVAKSFPSDQQKTRSDLLRKLEEHSSSHVKSQNDCDVSSLLASMRVEKFSDSRELSRSQMPTRQKHSMLGNDRLSDYDGSGGHSSSHARNKNCRKEVDVNMKLFDGRSLGIFSSKATPDSHEVAQRTPTLFDVLEREELSRLVSLPPDNRFEEMIRWTEEGKLWKFPIDNEQGMDGEMTVGFHEHVFIEQLIDKRFPERGPIRQFMELVAVGLSNNPYLSVDEKRAHVAWYANYFKDKYQFVEGQPPVELEETEIKTVDTQQQ